MPRISMLDLSADHSLERWLSRYLSRSQLGTINLPQLANRPPRELLEHPPVILPLFHPFIELADRSFPIADLDPI